jgi:hypothetical protein
MHSENPPIHSDNHNSSSTHFQQSPIRLALVLSLNSTTTTPGSSIRYSVAAPATYTSTPSPYRSTWAVQVPWSLKKRRGQRARAKLNKTPKSSPFARSGSLYGGLYPAPTFHMESIWNPCHSMSFQMDSIHSIWNMFWVKSHPNWCFCSMDIPHGMGGIHLESMESIWNIHMESTWNIPQAFHSR